MPIASTLLLIALSTLGASSGAADDAATARTASAPEIVMYASAQCGYCARARRWFAAQGVAYTEKDIDASTAAHAEWLKLGGNGVPLFVIDGEVSHGFTEDAMASRLAR